MIKSYGFPITEFPHHSKQIDETLCCGHKKHINFVCNTGQGVPVPAQNGMELVTTNHAIIESYEQNKTNGFFRLQNAASCYLNNDDTTNTKQAFHIFDIIMDFHKVKE